jgi:phage terminase large subunit-like protein
MAVIGPSEPDVREICLEGRSGLLNALGLHRESPEYARGIGQIRIANGTVIYRYSTKMGCLRVLPTVGGLIGL